MSRGWVALAACLVLATCLGLTFASAFVFASVPPVSATPASATAPASAQDGTVTGRPSLNLTVPDNRVAPGEVATVSAYLVNDARIFRGGNPRDEARVTTAFNVSVRPRTEALDGRLADALEFHTGRVPVGVVPSGVAGPIPFRVAVAESLPPGEYRIPFAVTYTYAAFVQPNESAPTLRTTTETLTATVVVEERPRLQLSAAPNQSLTPNENRVVRFEVTNVGSETARDVGLTFSADNGSVYFGSRLDRHSRVSFYLPQLAPGETEVVEARMGADDATPAGTYLVEGRATYRDEFGTVREADWLAAGVVVRGTEANQSSPAPSRTISPAPSRISTAIPVSKSAIAAAESSARPTPSRVPSS